MMMVNLGPVNMETKPAEALEKVLRTPENAVVFDESKISAPCAKGVPRRSAPVKIAPRHEASIT